MKEYTLGSEEFKQRGRDITALKINCVVSHLATLSSLFVFLVSLVILPVEQREKIELFPLLCLLVGTGGFSLGMIMSVIWYSEFKNLVEKSPGWEYLYSYGKSDLNVIKVLGIFLTFVGLVISWNLPKIGMGLLLVAVVIAILTNGCMLYQINRETKLKTFHA